MLGQRSGRIILGNPEAGNCTVIRMLQQPKGGAGYCDSLDILLQWNSAPFTAGNAIPLSIQIKGAGLVIRAFLSRFEIPRPRPSSKMPGGQHNLSLLFSGCSFHANERHIRPPFAFLLLWFVPCMSRQNVLLDAFPRKRRRLVARVKANSGTKMRSITGIHRRAHHLIEGIGNLGFCAHRNHVLR